MHACAPGTRAQAHLHVTRARPHAARPCCDCSAAAAAAAAHCAAPRRRAVTHANQCKVQGGPCSWPSSSGGQQGEAGGGEAHRQRLVLGGGRHSRCRCWRRPPWGRHRWWACKSGPSQGVPHLLQGGRTGPSAHRRGRAAGAAGSSFSRRRWGWLLPVGRKGVCGASGRRRGGRGQTGRQRVDGQGLQAEGTRAHYTTLLHCCFFPNPRRTSQPKQACAPNAPVRGERCAPTANSCTRGRDQRANAPETPRAVGRQRRPGACSPVCERLAGWRVCEVCG